MKKLATFALALAIGITPICTSTPLVGSVSVKAAQPAGWCDWFIYWPGCQVWR